MHRTLQFNPSSRCWSCVATTRTAHATPGALPFLPRCLSLPASLIHFPYRSPREIAEMKGAKSKSDAPKKADSKLSVKKKAAKPSQKPAKSQKADRDPNKPKRPPSAFFVFMEEFRKQYKEKHPNVKQVSVVGKAGGEKWKSLSAAEKAPYEAKAAKLKTEYGKKMDAYNNKDSGHGAEDEDEASDKSKSEVHDDDDEDESGEDDDDDDE